MYVSLAQAKASLEIAQDDMRFDGKLLGYINNAQARVDNDVQPYTNLPLEPGSNLFQSAGALCMLWIKRLWFKDQYQDPIADHHEADYMSTLSAFKARQDANKPERRLAAGYNGAPDAPIYEPAAADQYLAREFY